MKAASDLEVRRRPSQKTRSALPAHDPAAGRGRDFLARSSAGSARVFRRNFIPLVPMHGVKAGQHRQSQPGRRDAHKLCGEQRDIATSSFIEVWIDPPERRAWSISDARRVQDV